MDTLTQLDGSQLQFPKTFEPEPIQADLISSGEQSVMSVDHPEYEEIGYILMHDDFTRVPHLMKRIETLIKCTGNKYINTFREVLNVRYKEGNMSPEEYKECRKIKLMMCSVSSALAQKNAKIKKANQLKDFWQQESGQVLPSRLSREGKKIRNELKRVNPAKYKKLVSQENSMKRRRSFGIKKEEKLICLEREL